MNVVAPLSAVVAAFVPAIVGIATGERPSVIAVAGMAIALPAIWLVSRGGDGTPRRGGLSAGGADGLLAGAGFALLFIGLGRVPVGTGLWPLALAQAVSVPIIVALALGTRTSLRLPPRQVSGAAVVGVLGAAATLLYMFAARAQLLAVAAVLTSLYPALTIVLARVVLGERISATQGVGLGCAAAAVSLIALG
jgi:drug/metabolite transporter (DMT)-like permease